MLIIKRSRRTWSVVTFGSTTTWSRDGSWCRQDGKLAHESWFEWHLREAGPSSTARHNNSLVQLWWWLAVCQSSSKQNNLATETRFSRQRRVLDLLAWHTIAITSIELRGSRIENSSGNNSNSSCSGRRVSGSLQYHSSCTMMLKQSARANASTTMILSE